MKKPTMQDIARELGTSVVTVSNALNDRKGVSYDLRQIILKKADDLGYTLGSEKEDGRKRILTFGVICRSQYISEGSSFYWEMYQQVAAQAAMRGNLTMLEIFRADKGDGAMPSLPRRKEVDGVIVIGRLGEKYIRQILKDTQGNMIMLDFPGHGYECDAVLSANYSGMYRATRYLTQRGHKRIGFVGTIRTSRNVMDRFYGFLRCMREEALPVREEWLLEDRDVLTEQGRVFLPEELPSAFVCSSDYSAGLLYDELCRHDLRVPEDISVIGYDDYLYGNALARMLTSYHVDMEKMASRAVDLLQKRILGQRTETDIFYVDSHIVERKSVRQADQA